MAASPELDCKRKRRYKIPYKWCFVPLCTNTTVKTPTKIFVSVPKDAKRRKNWMKAAKRDVPKSKSTMYCCQDHFNMEVDADNWVHYNLVGGAIRMKPEKVPHIFDCQPNRKAAHSSTPRSAVVHKRYITQILSMSEIQGARELELLSTSQDTIMQETHSESLDLEVDGNNICSIATPTATFVDKGVQARPTYRSKGTSIDVSYLERDTSTASTACLPIKPGINVQTSPIKFQKQVLVKKVLELPSDTDSCESSVNATYTSATCTDTSYMDSDFEKFANDELQMLSLKRTLLLIEKHPRQYLGLPDDCWFLVDLLSKRLHSRKARENVLLTLKKLRLNASLVTLGHDFGISLSQASRIFKTTLPEISKYMKQLVVWPTKESIQQLLPISFRARFSNVQSIIDCFEIEIQKPSNPVTQALTWSEYKKANTVKYFVSSTPDGLVNFISSGYGGRTSDITITEHCGFLDKLTPGMAVMADRGFKHLDAHLLRKGCTLIRPPSVSADTKCTREDVIQTKVIASLRIHIERVIRRFREFAFLAPHACIDTESVYLADHAVIVAAGIVNLQGPLIK